MTLAEEELVDELLVEPVVFQVLLTSVWEIFATRAVKVFPEKASTVKVAICPTLTFPMSVSSTLALICFAERSAIRRMTVGLLVPCTAIVPGVCGSPTTMPSIGAVMMVSFRFVWVSSRLL